MGISSGKTFFAMPIEITGKKIYKIYIDNKINSICNIYIIYIYIIYIDNKINGICNCGEISIY